MSYYIKTATSIVLIVMIFSSCRSQIAGHPVECIKLNDQGVKYLMNYPTHGEKGLDTAIDLFKQSINCDSTNIISYSNLANAYDQKHNYSAEMTAFNKVLILTANNPAILTQKGMLFERMGNIDSAKEIYLQTKMEYERRLAKRPEDVGLITGMAELKGITDGKEEAIKILNDQIKVHPKLSSKLSQELLFYDYFNRHNYIFRLTTETNLNKRDIK